MLAVERAPFQSAVCLFTKTREGVRVKIGNRPEQHESQAASDMGSGGGDGGESNSARPVRIRSPMCACAAILWVCGSPVFVSVRLFSSALLSQLLSGILVHAFQSWDHTAV